MQKKREHRIFKKTRPHCRTSQSPRGMPFLYGGSFSLQGTIVYTKNHLEDDSDGLSGLGIQFRGYSDDASKRLKDYIETIIAEGPRIV